VRALSSAGNGSAEIRPDGAGVHPVDVAVAK
jgi:hypothetical protein